VNRPIMHLYLVVVLLFAGLVYATSLRTVFQAKALRDNPLNRRSLIQEQTIPRGAIRASDGTLLARSVKGANGLYHRVYPPSADLVAHALGYSFITIGRAGVEQSDNDDLTGARSGIQNIIDQIVGHKRQGDDVTLTLDPRIQKVAIDGLAGRKGSVVALDPRTGAVRAMASVPGYSPDALTSTSRYQQLNRSPGSPLFNRATQAGYPPGSTFKVVTAIAAIDSGHFTPASTVDGKNGVKISGVPLNNDFNQSFGPVDLTTALTKSINTVWAQVAEQLGKATMKTYMDRLGFDRKPPLDYPANQRRASGEYKGGNLLSPNSRFVDVGRMGIGQDKLAVTPLQMAMVAAAVANGGKLMKPQLTQRVVDRDGRTVRSLRPKVLDQVMKPQTAQAVGQMMSQVVKEGTGTAAALSGITVAGKTGTAEVGAPGSNINQVWFICFAPVEHPQAVVAVTVERAAGFGGTVAAPVAKSVLQAMLGGAA